MKQHLIQKATAIQSQATLPEQSFWVSASAGTGKTTILVRRLVRLLLDGVKPSQILCLTYTKVAANEMTERLLKTLKSFILLSEEALITELFQYVDCPHDYLKRARTLFVEVLDELHTVKIQTIHAFCQTVLKKFSAEAELDPNFSMLDETQERFFIQRSYDQLLARAYSPQTQADSQLREAFEHISGEMSAFAFETYKRAILSERRHFTRLV
ncbi:MAG: UvrD-helicase domain-containing protein, partial [Alphaproteobacteria bacterium]|nr:UvrD-helicase domain-containing protein [Alphaproteobacteria bacterium]